MLSQRAKALESCIGAEDWPCAKAHCGKANVSAAETTIANFCIENLSRFERP
jgi:hypothetical protein